MKTVEYNNTTTKPIPVMITPVIQLSPVTEKIIIVSIN
jgi:hypothetical protein